jgi:hypothetical protein
MYDKAIEDYSRAIQIGISDLENYRDPAQGDIGFLIHVYKERLSTYLKMGKYFNVITDVINILRMKFSVRK